MQCIDLYTLGKKTLNIGNEEVGLLPDGRLAKWMTDEIA
jgi:hypothetical protein